ERILKYFEEINAVPVPYKWKYKMDTIDLEKEDINEIVYEVVNAKAAGSDNKDKRAPEKKKRKSQKQDNPAVES
ncbi:MAG: IS630 family transposase, partial [Lachnospiraceae bacterium]|nr:IS630 family transposase [Lachnospiraceae bacterium]